MMAPYVNTYRRYGRTMSAPVNSRLGLRQPHHGAFACRSPTPHARRSRTGCRARMQIPISRSRPRSACGYLGIEDRARADATRRTASRPTRRGRLPRDLLEGRLAASRTSPALAEVFGKEFSASTGDQARRVRDLHAGDQPLGTGIPAPQRLREKVSWTIGRAPSPRAFPGIRQALGPGDLSSPRRLEER